MTDLKSPAVPAVVLRRTYRASPQRVYEAWTNPDIMSRFMGPGDTECKNITMDVRPGGTYSLTMDSPEMGEMIATGTYRDVQPPHRLSMTWRWKEEDPAEEHESLLTVEFHDHNGDTELVLKHEQLASVESRDRHEQGWTMIVDQLAGVF